MSNSVILIFGGDEYLVSAKAKQVVDGLVPPADQAFGLEVIDGAADKVEEALKVLDACLGALRTVGLFGASKVVWLRDAGFLHDNRTGKSAVVKEQLAVLVKEIKNGLPEGVKLVVSSAAVDKRYAFYKACKAAGQIFEFAVPDKDYAAVRNAQERVFELLKKHKLSMQKEVLEDFLGRVGYDTRQIVNEMEKLSVYLGREGPVSGEDVKAIVCSSRSALAWDLADALGARDLSKTLSICRQLLFQGESAIGLVMGVERRLRDLRIYREGLDNGWLVQRSGRRGPELAWGKVPPDVERVFSEILDKDPRRTHPFRVNILANQARRFSSAELIRAQRAAMDTREKLVSSGVDVEILLEMLLARILGVKGKKSASRA